MLVPYQKKYISFWPEKVLKILLKGSLMEMAGHIKIKQEINTIFKNSYRPCSTVNLGTVPYKYHQ